MMLVLVARTWTVPHLNDIVEENSLALPEDSSVVVNLNDTRTHVILGRKYKNIYGREVLLEQSLGSELLISPDCF